MDKHIEPMPIRKLEADFRTITFPEYQREASLWSLAEKQRLIDSIVRRFDIAALYFYRHDDGALECVDGRQRIGTILAFLGHNPDDDNNKFTFRNLNEIYDDPDPPFPSLQGRKFSEIRTAEDKESKNFAESFLRYPLTAVILSNSNRDEEFNLQFTRLNLGVLVNSGEKLNAMVGELRDTIFGDTGLGKHSFLEAIKMPGRRFGKEQTAAQIIAQVFARVEDKDYARTRQLDLQRLFKANGRLSPERRETMGEVKGLLDVLEEGFRGRKIKQNRAMAVSTVLLAWESKISDGARAKKLAEFVDALQCRLKWQVGLGLDASRHYQYLVDLQRQVTQASVEKPAVTRRAEVMNREFARWEESAELLGDVEWSGEHDGLDPNAECQGTSQ